MRLSVAESSSIVLARAVVRCLAAQGVRDVVYCPGSRSAPLAYALAEAEAAGELCCHVRLDERAAAFVAVGLSRAGALGASALDEQAPAPRPVAIMCTSGGAVAEFHAGVAEASHSMLPLIVVSADRPFEMRDVGASQTTTQVGIFGAHVRATWDIPAGTAADARLEALVARACAAAQGAPSGRPGPVHLNVAFRDPLIPQALQIGTESSRSSDMPASSGLITTPARSSAAGSDTSGCVVARPWVLSADLVPLPWGQAVNPELRTVIIAGDGANPQAASWAEIAGIPLLAEPSSNVTISAAWVPHQQTLLTAIARASSAGSDSLDSSRIAHIEQVVVTGRPTLSRPVSALLARADVRVIVEHPHEQWPDVAGQADIVCARLAAPLGPHADEGWLSAWHAAATTVSQRLEERHEPRGAASQTTARSDAGSTSAPTSPALSLLTVAEEIWASTEAPLLLGASNSVRAVDLVARGRGRSRVCANRGLAGIDGTIATALGLAWGVGEPVRVMLGDLAFFHDVSALSIAPGESVPDIQIVLVDDQGGGIFASLEHGRPEYAQVFERWFGTPQHVSVKDLAAAYGVAYSHVETIADLRERLSASPCGIEIIHAKIMPAYEELAWVKECFTLP